MKFSTAFVAAAAAGLAAAQSQCLSTAVAIPSCGQSCLTVAGSSYGCQYTDFACQCSHSSQINNAQLTSCVLSACGGAQTALSVSQQAEALCSCVSANGGSGGGAAGASSTAAIPVTTAAIGQPTGGSNSKATSAAAPSMTMQQAASSKPVSMFTGGAAYAAGSVGGVLAAILGLVAAL